MLHPARLPSPEPEARVMRAVASPSVRRLARDHGIDPDELALSLGRQTIGREDILAAAHGIPPDSDWDVDHAEWGPVTTRPLDRPARIATDRLTAAWQAIPAVTHHDLADLTRIEATRARLKSDGVRITALAFHVAVLARCLKEHPTFNASLSADGTSLVLKGYVHIGIAAATKRGLVVPVIRNADQKRLLAIAAELADLAERARERRIRPEEMGGASMTISSLGRSGGRSFTPIVNPPELAILGISRTEIRPHWDGQEFVPRTMVPLDLTYDHRAINGADAAAFMTRYRELLADPDMLLTLR